MPAPAVSRPPAEAATLPPAATTLPPSAQAAECLELAELLSHAARRLRRGSAAHLAPLGLTMAQARVLRIVAARTVRMADIAAHLDVVPRTVTPMVDGLESAGLVRRRPDPGDRRSVLVELTGSGRKLLARLDAARLASAEQVFGALGADERRQLTALLGRLCHSATCATGGGDDGGR